MKTSTPVTPSHVKQDTRSHACGSLASASASIMAKNMPNEQLAASTVVLKSENSHHFWRAASRRSMVFSALGDIALLSVGCVKRTTLLLVRFTHPTFYPTLPSNPDA